MGVEPELLLSLWKTKVRELVGEDRRKAEVAKVFNILTGKTEVPKTRGYAYYIVGRLDDEEHTVQVEFCVESTKELRINSGKFELAFEVRPKAIANDAFVAVAKTILEKHSRMLQPYTKVIAICPECDEETVKEYGLLVGEENTNTAVYVTESYSCRCKESS